jgi:high-affinity iron transporter
MSSSLVPSFLLTFREGLEATLIVVIVASYLKRTGKRKLSIFLYFGAIAAMGASLLLGLAISMVYGGLEDTFAGVFDGVAALTAAGVLTYMIVWMTRHAQTLRSELEQKLESSITAGQLLGVASLSFVAVLREGVETVLFLTALVVIDSSGTLIGAVIASLASIGIAVLVMKGIHRLDIHRFFQVTSMILIVFAAGLTAYGVHELIEVGERSGIELGLVGQQAFNMNPPVNPDGTYPALHDKGAVGSVLATLVGYAGSPEWLRVIAYLGYWIVLGTYLFITDRIMKRQLHDTYPPSDSAKIMKIFRSSPAASAVNRTRFLTFF